MNYSLDRALLLAEQLRQLATRQAFALAGHHANLAFWLAETEQALATVDGYQERWRRQRDAQAEWVRLHGTRLDGPCDYCGGTCELGKRPPAAPLRTAGEDLDEARSQVRAGFLAFLLRLHRFRLLAGEDVRELALRVKAPFDSEDLRDEEA